MIIIIDKIFDIVHYYVLHLTEIKFCDLTTVEHLD